MPNTVQVSRAAEDQFELVVHLQQFGSSPPSDGAADLRSRAQTLVRDTLISRLGVDPGVDTQNYVHARGFSDLGKALAVSRALQIAFEGFRDALPSARVNVSVVLDSAPEEALSTLTGISVEQKDLLDFAKPSQVLVTQTFYDRVVGYQPGLRSFPQRAGVYEFLWTNEERLKELQAEAEFTPTLVIEPATPAVPMSNIVTQSGAPATEIIPVEGTWRPRRDRNPEPDDEEPVRKLPRILALGSAAAVLIGIGIGYLVTTQRATPRSVPVAPKAPAVDSRPAPSAIIESLKPSSLPPSPQPAPTTDPTTTTVSKQGASAGPTPVSPSSGAAKAVSQSCSISGLIPNYLSMADNNRIQSQYDAAIRQYKAVLSCEPGNREARAGLQRTKDAERLSGVVR